MESNLVADMEFLEVVLNIALVMVGISLLLCFYRLVKGPTLADRIVSSDAVSVNVITLIAIYSMKQNTDLYLSAILVIAVLGFNAMVVFSKYLHRGSLVYQMYKPAPKKEEE